MTENAESVLVRADMSALEFHEAAWEARAAETPPPSPLTLSDRALAMVMAYAEADLPSETKGMLEGAKDSIFGESDDAEDEDDNDDGGSRRTRQRSRAGFVFGWMLFV